MYLPKHFEETRPEILHALIAAHPLATLVTLRAGELVADHIPLIFDPTRGAVGTLRGHVARANPLWKATASGTEALAVFQGPEAYITPSWYPGKREHGKVVPTWNYAVVHAHGPLQIFDDAEWLREFLPTLTAHMESPRAAPWQVSDAPEDYLETMLRAIVGIEIPVARLVGKWKMSQNRPAVDRVGVAVGLQAENEASRAVAELVRPE